MKRAREWDFCLEVLELLRDRPYQGSARPSVLLRHYGRIFEEEATMMEAALERNRRLSLQRIRDMHAPSIGELAAKVQEYVASVVGNDNLASALDYILNDDDAQHLFSQFHGARSCTEESEVTRSRTTAAGSRSDYLCFASTLMGTSATIGANEDK